MKPTDSFVGQPIRSLQTMLRVLAEDNIRMPTVVPDGIYGASTVQAVRFFQKENKLADTGIVDQATWDSIVTEYENALIRVDKAEPIEIIMDPGQVYQLGSTSPYIYLLQSMLIQLSFDHPTIQEPDHNGTLDELTAASLRGFQELSALPVTGELDKITWKHLVRQYALYAHHHAAERPSG